MLILLFPLSKVDRRELINCFICLSTPKSFLHLKLKGSCQKILKCGIAWNELMKPKPSLVGKLRKAGGIHSGSEVETTKTVSGPPSQVLPSGVSWEFLSGFQETGAPLRDSLLLSLLPSQLSSTPGPQRALGLLGNGKWLLLNCSRL